MSCARTVYPWYPPLFAIDDSLDSLPRLNHGVGLYHIRQLKPVSEEAVPWQIIARNHGQGLMVMFEVGSKAIRIPKFRCSE